MIIVILVLIWYRNFYCIRDRHNLVFTALDTCYSQLRIEGLQLSIILLTEYVSTILWILEGIVEKSRGIFRVGLFECC